MRTLLTARLVFVTRIQVTAKTQLNIIKNTTKTAISEITTPAKAEIQARTHTRRKSGTLVHATSCVLLSTVSIQLSAHVCPLKAWSAIPNTTVNFVTRA